MTVFKDHLLGEAPHINPFRSLFDGWTARQLQRIGKRERAEAALNMDREVTL